MNKAKEGEFFYKVTQTLKSRESTEHRKLCESHHIWGWEDPEGMGLKPKVARENHGCRVWNEGKKNQGQDQMGNGQEMV